MSKILLVETDDARGVALGIALEVHRQNGLVCVLQKNEGGRTGLEAYRSITGHDPAQRKLSLQPENAR